MNKLNCTDNLDRKMAAMKIIPTIKRCMGNVYGKSILEHKCMDGRTILDNLIEEVMSTPSWKDNKKYTSRDTHTAIGKVLLKELNEKKER